MPAGHSAFCVFGKNQAGFVPVEILFASLHLDIIVVVPYRDPVPVSINKYSRRQEENEEYVYGAAVHGRKGAKTLPLGVKYPATIVSPLRGSIF